MPRAIWSGESSSTMVPDSPVRMCRMSRSWVPAPEVTAPDQSPSRPAITGRGSSFPFASVTGKVRALAPLPDPGLGGGVPKPPIGRGILGRANDSWAVLDADLVEGRIGVADLGAEDPAGVGAGLAGDLHGQPVVADGQVDRAMPVAGRLLRPGRAGQPAGHRQARDRQRQDPAPEFHRHRRLPRVSALDLEDYNCNIVRQRCVVFTTQSAIRVSAAGEMVSSIRAYSPGPPVSAVWKRC